MKLICPKHLSIKLIGFTILLIVLVFLVLKSNAQKYVSLANQQLIDSTHNKPNVREVLTSQQLFVVEISDTIYSTKDTTVKFRAELRDAFKVIGYDDNRSYTELEWVMCPEDNCPVPRLYKLGTADYNKLDRLIADAKNKTNAPTSIQ